MTTSKLLDDKNSLKMALFRLLKQVKLAFYIRSVNLANHFPDLIFSRVHSLTFSLSSHM